MMESTKKSKKSKQQSSQDQFQTDSSDLLKTEPAKKRKQRGEGRDAKEVSNIISKFDQEKSFACNKLQNQFSSGITHNELLAIAELICTKTTLDLSRQARRDDRVLHKWYDDNWDIVAPHIQRLNIFDKNHVLIKDKTSE